MKESGRSLGFSIAGGRGSMPAYEDVDDGVFITKIATGGLAEADGRLRLGDRLLSVSRDVLSMAVLISRVGQWDQHGGYIPC